MGANCLPGRLVSQVYVGTHARLKVAVGEEMVQLVAEASTIKRFKQGDPITLHFPEDKIWVLPPD